MGCPAWLRAKRCGQLALGLGLDEAKIPISTPLSRQVTVRILALEAVSGENFHSTVFHSFPQSLGGILSWFNTRRRLWSPHR